MGCISRINLCPASGDTENVLLQKILQSLNEGAGGGSGGGVTGLSVDGGPFQTGQVSIVTGVSSVNGDTGPAVLLDSGEIPEGANLYFTEARVRSTVLTGLVIAGGAVTAADTVLSALGKYQFRIDALETGASGPFLLRAGDTGTGPFVFTPSAANTTPLTLSGYSLTGATAIPALSIAGEWNTTGAPTLLDVDVLNTASNSAAILFNFKLSTVSVLNLRKDGRFTLAGRAAFNDITGVGHSFTQTNATTSSTPTAVLIQRFLSAGVPVAGFGVATDWLFDSTTTVGTLAARLITNWVDPTHATRSSQQIFQQQISGTLTTALVLANGQTRVQDGSAATPALSFINDTDTGIYRTVADSIVFGTGGVLRGFFFTTGFTVSSGQLFVQNGTAALPSLTIESDPNTGIFSIAADTLGFSTGGTLRLTLSTSLLTSTVPIQQSDSTALVADPTAASTQQSVAGEWQYRSSAASEGAGQTNRVHNRAGQVIGSGTDYTLTTSLARVDFGTTDPEVVLPTAGTYLIRGGVEFLSSALSTNDIHGATLRNATDSVFIGDTGLITLGVSFYGKISVEAIVTVTASKTIQIWAFNTTVARGSVVSGGHTSISYVRLS